MFRISIIIIVIIFLLFLLFMTILLQDGRPMPQGLRQGVVSGASAGTAFHDLLEPSVSRLISAQIVPIVVDESGCGAALRQRP